MSRSIVRPAVALVGALVALLSACGQDTTSAASPASADAVVFIPAPVPTIEPTCIADYPAYATAADLVSQADVVVRVTATGPSRDYDLRPEPPSSDDPAISPQAGMSPEEIAEIPGIPATAITVEVTEVLKGDVAVGDLVEVNQSMCTARPLPVGAETDYLLALSAHDPGDPMSQLNDHQAAWQVASDRTLVPVDPQNDLGVESIEQLASAVGAGKG